MSETFAEVESIKALTDSVLEFVFKPKDFISYSSGQYLKIISGREAYPFSIANAPLGAHKLELHIRHTKENPYNQAMLEDIKEKGYVTISMPFGECKLSNLSNRDIVFIAGGTGFAPVKAMIEQLFAEGDKRHIHFFWGARSLSDLYLNEMVLHWENSVDQFHYHNIIDERKSDALQNMVVDTLGSDLNKMQIVAFGRFNMIYKARDLFVANGFDEQYMHADAFSFEEKK
jgi:CDP-4-dehydro-6-deoxyglucose reductase